LHVIFITFIYFLKNVNKHSGQTQEGVGWSQSFLAGCLPLGSACSCAGILGAGLDRV